MTIDRHLSSPDSHIDQFVVRQQRIDSEKDQEWLHREETNLVRRKIPTLNLFLIIPQLLQKKRLSITNSFGSEHSDSSEGVLVPGLAAESPPHTPLLLPGQVAILPPG